MKNPAKTSSKLRIRPIGDRILVQYVPEKEEIRGGLIIPDSAREKPQKAKVIALGTGRKAKDGTLLPFAVKVGDVVLIAKFSGAEVRLDEVHFSIVRESDILGVLN